MTQRLPVDIDQAPSRSLVTGTDAAEFSGAFPILNDAHLSELHPCGTERELGLRETPFRAGQVATAVGKGAMVIRLTLFGWHTRRPSHSSEPRHDG